MRYWYESEKLPFEQFLTADGVHMNDWGYACIAQLLASAIADGVKPPAATARMTRELTKR
jgi:lysophospholipase L1-like esterase